jgi:Raf kinase inhibitor-like YbhB/YbcL family protein
MALLPCVLLAAATLTACSSQPTTESRSPNVVVQLTSTDFEAGQVIPKEFTGEGEDRSPQLSWGELPDGTRELALICDDPDAPTSTPWVHWVLYGIQPDVSSLPAGLPKDAEIDQPIRALQGKNSWTSGQTVGYRGPMPPPGHGVHHYHFKLFALDAPLGLKSQSTKAELLAAMEGHVLGTGELIGTYELK